MKVIVEKEKIYGLYSEKQRQVSGLVVYSDHYGNIKYVTEVNENPNYVGYWDDVVKIGELSRFIGRIDYGTSKLQRI